MDTEKTGAFLTDGALLRGRLGERLEELRALSNRVVSESFFASGYESIQGVPEGPSRVDAMLETLVGVETFVAEVRGDLVAADQPQQLEDADVTVNEENGVFTFSTGAGDDNVDVEETVDGRLIMVVNGNIVELTSEQSANFRLDTGAGDDTVDIGETVQATTDVFTGPGDDHVEKAVTVGGTRFEVIPLDADPQRPNNVTHDPQFDGYPPEDPTIADKAFYAEWELINQGAKVATETGIRDLDEATGAYDHFLYGNGEPRTFSVERFVREDGEGQVMLEEARNAAERASIELGNEPGTYRFVSNTVSHTGNPETENWQKTIGKAQYWTDTTVVVTENPDGTINRELSITINMEDKYDFNPGEGDIASGVSDDANGRFQVVGLADSYIHTGSATFTHSFDDDELSGPPTIHQPSDDGGRVRDESRSERDPLGGQRTSGAGREQERNSVGDVAREN